MKIDPTTPDEVAMCVRKVRELRDAIGTAGNEPQTAEKEALREILYSARADLDVIREALGVPIEPHQSLIERMVEAAQAKRGRVTEGWKLVRSPITEDMHVAAAKVLTRAHGLDGTPQRMLDAMLAAAPAAPEHSGWAQPEVRALATPEEMQRGYHVLRTVVTALRETGRYRDEEGEDTDALADLADRLGKPSAAPAAVPDHSGDAAELRPEFSDSARAALLWVLWHHQGGSSPVGQPIRFALGMGRHEHLSDWQVAEAKRWGELRGEVKPEKCDGNHAGPRCADPECWNDDAPIENGDDIMGGAA